MIHSDAALVKPFTVSTARAALRRAAELAVRRRAGWGPGPDRR